jgi:hypothetical protein
MSTENPCQRSLPFKNNYVQACSGEEEKPQQAGGAVPEGVSGMMYTNLGYVYDH